MASRGFESLPAEVILQILPHLPDLESLNSIIRASPSAWRIFDTYAAEIAEQVLDAKYTHQYTRIAIRSISYVRQDCFPINTVSDFQRRISRAVTLHDGYRDNTSWVKPCEDPFAPRTFPPQSSSSAIRSILATGRRIRALTHECLDFYLARFRPLQPLVPVQPDFYPRIQTCAVGLSAENPPKEPYDRHDIGAPNWIEEQYVYLAFWRIQCVRDLKAAMEGGTISNWDEEEAYSFCNMDLFDLYDFREVEEEIRSRCELAEHGLVLSVLHFLEQQPKDHHWVEPSSRVVTDPGPGDDKLFRECWTSGPGIWEGIYLYFQRSLDEDHESFTAFRQLGFAIWSDKRLAGYGFSQSGNSGDRVLFSYLIAWISVLTPKELTHLEQLELNEMHEDEIKELEQVRAGFAHYGTSDIEERKSGKVHTD